MNNRTLTHNPQLQQIIDRLAPPEPVPQINFKSAFERISADNQRYLELVQRHGFGQQPPEHFDTPQLPIVAMFTMVLIFFLWRNTTK